MVSGRPPRRRIAWCGAALVVVLASLAACSGSGGGEHHGAPAASGSSRTSTSRPVVTVDVISRVSGGKVGVARRMQMKKEVDAVVDRWLDGAYLGSFPRSDYSDAFSGFTPQAAALAMRQLDVMSNQSISGRISAATATSRRIRLAVFAPRGHPRGVTVDVALDFTTSGQLTGSRRMTGQLDLTRPKGQPWRIFGFRVDQPVAR